MNVRDEILWQMRSRHDLVVASLLQLLSHDPAERARARTWLELHVPFLAESVTDLHELDELLKQRDREEARDAPSSPDRPDRNDQPDDVP